MWLFNMKMRISKIKFIQCNPTFHYCFFRIRINKVKFLQKILCITCINEVNIANRHFVIDCFNFYYFSS